MSARTWAVVLLLTAAYVGLAGAAVLDGRFLHDEGVLTHLLASLVGREPLATVFLQKARPPLAVLYAPVAPAGFGAFCWAHVLVAALAVPLVASTAARLGHARPELPAAVVALSPMHVAAGAAGLMNADAVVGVALVALSWSRQRWLTTGVVAGVLVWVRAELAVLALVLAVWAAWRRRPRVLLGLCAFPLVYGVAGAIYHRELVWMLWFPPALAAPMEGNPFWEAHQAQASLPVVMAAALSITPVVALLGLWRASSAHAVERAGLVFVGLFAGALVLLPRWQLFNFDLSPRYLLPVLPFLALAVSRVVEQWGAEPGAASPRRRGLGLLAFAILAFASERAGGRAGALVVGGLASLAVALGGAGLPALARVPLATLLALGPVVFGDGARIARHQHSPTLDRMVLRLREHPDWAGRPIYTNEPLLAEMFERGGGLPGSTVHYLVQADQLHELTSLSNPNNGQRQALLQALRLGFYGAPVMPDELTPSAVPAGAVFVLREDSRLALVMPPELWDPLLEVVYPGGGMTIALRREGGP
ncbi:hypothetical protein [Paraliomyxa miuraensis]|uniref:hypothetical protein n=1 Tax=Paraliomyxa miuraensis TaxID=376150 RepID=UPI0022558ED8|nr:hypothetical protein [Paraliomyxa miuraensis]MCX4241959.1 hypothetical protein [Paraliomyxa miuraensis]